MYNLFKISKNGLLNVGNGILSDLEKNKTDPDKYKHYLFILDVYHRYKSLLFNLNLNKENQDLSLFQKLNSIDNIFYSSTSNMALDSYINQLEKNFSKSTCDIIKISIFLADTENSLNNNYWFDEMIKIAKSYKYFSVHNKNIDIETSFIINSLLEILTNLGEDIVNS